MYKNNYRQNFFWIRYGGIFFCSAIFIFFMVALSTYYPFDVSWFYATNELAPIHNGAGPFGAFCAALLLYFFGGAAFCCIVPLLFMVLFLVKQWRFKDEWERFFACCYFVCISAAILATAMFDFSWSPYPGGVIGMIFAQRLVAYCDPVGRILFLTISMAACFFLLFRFSFMFLVNWLIKGMVYSVMVMRRYQVVSRIANAFVIGLYYIFVYPVRIFYSFMWSLVDGSAFDDTGLVVPQQEQEDDNSDDLLLNATENRMYVFEPIDEVLPSHTDAGYTASVLDADNNREQLQRIEEPKDGQRDNDYSLPHPDIFIAEKSGYEDNDLEKELEARAHVLEDKLKRFGVSGMVTAIKRGPVVTLFEYQPDVDTKISKIIALEDDLAMALQAMSIRIIAPIPGRSVVGFEVANTKRNDVLFSQVVNSPLYKNFSGSLPLVLGKGTIGEAVVVDLARMPHLLIAGSTGSGKSVALNALLISLLCKLDPDQLKLILIDPKRLEFASFTDIAHLLFPIVTSPHHAAPVLRWVVQEMEQRYEKMAERGARNIVDYNSRAKEDGDAVLLPSIVVVIDELADLMITSGRDIEDLITRITQMARAAGIHMIVATQRPSVDVITGLIKANFPSRISFRVASRIDSRTILDTMGADRLLGRGDMLFLDAATSQLRRVHGAYVSDEEIESVVNHIRAQRKVNYLDIHQEMGTQGNNSSTDDVLYQDVRLFLNEIDEVSISLLQRKFRIGYNRSARIIDVLESQGLIMPQDGSKTRKVIR